MDSLEGLSGSGSASESGSEQEDLLPAGVPGPSAGPGHAGLHKGLKRAKSEITVEQLEQCGYKSGPSVLLMKRHDEGEQNDWNW